MLSSCQIVAVHPKDERAPWLVDQILIVPIFEKEVEITEKVDGCFTYATPVILADGSRKPIGQIVNQKLKVDVLSYNQQTGNIEIKPVTNWFKHGRR